MSIYDLKGIKARVTAFDVRRARGLPDNDTQDCKTNCPLGDGHADRPPTFKTSQAGTHWRCWSHPGDRTAATSREAMPPLATRSTSAVAGW